MELVESRQNGCSLPDVGLDGCSMEQCFARLVDVEGSFSVACGKGYLRRLAYYISKNYKYVKAAGGLVRDDEGRLLLMCRNGRSDLPKGKVEVGETLAQAAIRETEEETGLTGLLLGSLRLKTYHIYNLYGGWHFKQTSWFDMRHSGAQPLVPQTEEGITEVGWIDEKVWKSKLDNSYATMKIITRQMTD